MNIKSFMFLSLITFFYSGISAQSAVLTPVVCQNKKCYPATAALSREVLFEQIQNLINNNINKNILLCEANPQTKMCLTKGFSLPLQSGLIQTDLEILSAKITEQKNIKKTTGSDLIIDYKTKAGNIHPNCQTAPSRLGVLNYQSVQIIAPEFSCSLTASNQTAISLIYHIDYINFDNGTIGAYYTIGAQKKAVGQKSGYLLFRFTQPVSKMLTTQFPMPDVFHAFKVEQQKAHGKIDPVWLKPTPILNIENQNIVISPTGTPSVSGSSNKLPQAPANTPSTTGLITQNKTILPPTNGIRKTVTVKKQIYQEGKPVIYEEDVQRYIQENENAPFIEEQKLIQQAKDSSLQIPDMPKVSMNQQNIPTEIPSYIFPYEISLTDAEKMQIQNKVPFPQDKNTQASSNQQTTQEKDDSSTGVSSFFSKLAGKFEKYFYF